MVSREHKTDLRRIGADIRRSAATAEGAQTADAPWLKSLRSKRVFDARKSAPTAEKRPTRSPLFVKAAPLRLPRRCTGEDALVGTIDNCLTHLSANEECALTGTDPEGVHQMRVALRRLDAALTLYGSLIPAPQRESLQRRIKTVAQTLSPARDWDVFIGEMLDPVASDLSNDPDLKLLRTEALRRRAAAYREVQRALRSPFYAEMWQELAGWLANREWRQQPVTEASVHLMTDALSFSETILDRAHRKLLKRGKGIAVLTQRERHKLRIRIKKVRYAAEFFAPLYAAKQTKRYLGALRAMQNQLGRLNDIEAARGLIDGLSAGTADRNRRIARAGGLIVGWHRHAAAAHEGELARGWRKLETVTPFWR